jgi:hypothetical protein
MTYKGDRIECDFAKPPGSVTQERPVLNHAKERAWFKPG